jgi:surface antigen
MASKNHRQDNPVGPAIEERSTEALPVVTDDSSAQPLFVTARQLTIQQQLLVTRRLPATLGTTTSQRMPVVIKGTMKKPVMPVQPPHRRRRLIVNLVGVAMVFLVLSLALLLVSPVGHEIGLKFNPLLGNNSLVKGSNANPSSLVAQYTAIAIFNEQNDGYDPSSNGSQYTTNGSGSLDWPVGQCTYWANTRYHQLTGFWVNWSGNADEWVTGARVAGDGWNVTQTPHWPSIIVLMPYVQLASSYGHVAVVEKIINSTTVETSNMNWSAAGGGFDIVSLVNFTVGSGVYFVWHS